MTTLGGTSYPLNDEQRRAVEMLNEPVAVLAGPGSGKTRVIVARIVHLVQQGVEPSTILGVTFTVKAAAEMRERLARLLPAEVSERVRLGTFHAWAVQMLRSHGSRAGVPRQFTLMDSALQIRMLTEIVRALMADGRLSGDVLRRDPTEFAKDARGFIAACRHRALGPAQASRHAAALRARAEAPSPDADGAARARLRVDAQDAADRAAVFAEYQQAVLASGRFTYDDLLVMPLLIAERAPETAEYLRDGARHLVVDEFQDSNGAQIELLKLLSPPGSTLGARTRTLCVVGDDDQAIYGFRGSSIAAFETFNGVWARAQTVALDRNYRSGARIVNVAGRIIEGAHRRAAHKKLVSERPGLADEVRVFGTPKDTDYANAAAALLLGARAAEPDRPWSQYAVIVYANNDADRVAEVLHQQGIPYDRRRKLRTLEHESVRDLLAWLKAATDPGDAASVQRLLARPPVLTASEELATWAGAWKSARSRGDDRGFADWVRQEHGTHAGVSRFAATLEAVRHVVLSQRADGAVRAVILRAGLIDAEGDDGAAREQRIGALLRLVMFARRRQDVLEEPGDAAALLRYLKDLDTREQELEEDADVLDEGDREDESGDAVTVVTAHKAKGLEFDTVIVARVSPPHGFPKRKSGDEDDPLTAMQLEEADPHAHADEQRRLFYVACTRAQRRLWITTTAGAAKSSAAVHFVRELVDKSASGPGLPLVIHDAPDLTVAARADAEAARAVAAPGAGGDAARATEIEMQHLRRHAFAALHDAARADEGAPPIEQVEAQLREAARALRGAAHLSRTAGRSDGGMLDERSPLQSRLVQLALTLRGKGSGPAWLRPCVPPLRLSYSKLAAYLRCPRCYYLKYEVGLDEPTSASLDIGNIVHAALQQLFEAARQAEDRDRPPPTVEEAEQVARRAYREGVRGGRPLNPEDERRIAALVTSAYTRLHRPGDAIDSLERETTFAYSPVDGSSGPHTLQSKIDRLDFDHASGSWRIIDYKTGKATKGQLEPEPDDLQFGVYALALAHLNQLPEGELPEGTAEYWMLQSCERGVLALRDLRLDKVRKGIDKAISGMLAGRFDKAKDCDRDCDLLG